MWGDRPPGTMGSRSLVNLLTLRIVDVCAPHALHNGMEYGVYANGVVGGKTKDDIRRGLKSVSLNLRTSRHVHLSDLGRGPLGQAKYPNNISIAHPSTLEKFSTSDDTEVMWTE